MSPLRILNSSEKNEVGKKLNRQFGINSIPQTIVKHGKDKMFLFSGSLENKKIKLLEKAVYIERMGVYFGKVDERTKDIRLSIEGSQIFKSCINKNLFEINDEQTQEWMKGNELRIKTGKRGFLVLKNKEDFLGTGKASEEKIGNFIPKSRRLKN
jgi:NOL1/NOP2/fmu family ribosome biogenesis protein|tara:strand:- start:854 stop:1318 length:465 start_codon:yes stop_codon:yes gene_type:complete